MHQLNGWRRGRSAERHQYRFVAGPATRFWLLLWSPAAPEQKSRTVAAWATTPAGGFVNGAALTAVALRLVPKLG